jgi:hypothetical protein
MSKMFKFSDMIAMIALFLISFIPANIVEGHATPSRSRPPYRRFGGRAVEQPKVNDWGSEMGYSFELYPTAEIVTEVKAALRYSENEEEPLSCYFDKQSSCGAKNGICPFDGRPCTADRHYFDHVYGRHDDPAPGVELIGTHSDFYSDRIRLMRESLGKSMNYITDEEDQQNRDLINHLNLVREVDLPGYGEPTALEQFLQRIGEGVSNLLGSFFDVLYPKPDNFEGYDAFEPYPHARG